MWDQTPGAPWCFLAPPGAPPPLESYKGAPAHGMRRSGGVKGSSLVTKLLSSIYNLNPWKDLAGARAFVPARARARLFFSYFPLKIYCKPPSCICRPRHFIFSFPLKIYCKLPFCTCRFLSCTTSCQVAQNQQIWTLHFLHAAVSSLCVRLMLFWYVTYP